MKGDVPDTGSNRWLGVNKFFSPAGWKKYPELVPLVAIASVVPLFALITIRHNLFHNASVRYSNKRDQHRSRHDEVGSTECRKYYNSQPEIYKPIPELEDVKTDLIEAAPERED